MELEQKNKCLEQTNKSLYASTKRKRSQWDYEIEQTKNARQKLELENNNLPTNMRTSCNNNPPDRNKIPPHMSTCLQHLHSRTSTTIHHSTPDAHTNHTHGICV